MATICAKSSYRAVATRCCWSPTVPTRMEPVARKTAGFPVPVQLSQLGAGNRQKTRCAYQCEIAPWRPSLLVVSRPCSSATSGSQHAARAAALHAPNPPPAAKSAHENAISGPCMRFWRGSSPWPSTERSAGAAAVINDEGFAEAFGQLGCQRARKGVRPAAGRERHDHRHRLLGPGLCDGLLVQLCWAGLRGCSVRKWADLPVRRLAEHPASLVVGALCLRRRTCARLARSAVVPVLPIQELLEQS